MATDHRSKHEAMRARACHDGARRTEQADLPKQTPPQVHRLMAHVGAAGPACKAFAQGLEAERGALALRPLFGLCDLIKRHGNERVERVCALALSAGTLRLRFLRKALDVETIPSLLDENRIIELISTYQTHFSTLAQEVVSDDK